MKIKRVILSGIFVYTACSLSADETVSGQLTVDQDNTDTALAVKGGSSGTPLAVFLRDNGTGSNVAQVRIDAGGNNPEMSFSDYSTAGTWVLGLKNSDNSFRISQAGNLHAEENNHLTISNDGNVGIGNVDPQAKLEVEKPWGSGGPADVAAFFGGRTANDGRYNTYIIGHTISTGYGNDRDDAGMWINWNGYMAGKTRYRNLCIGDGKGTSILMVKGSVGNVGIGTMNPENKLDVAGTIRAEEIIVASDWADFVFEDDYDLMPLNQVQTYIQENKRLPGLPSAEEVQEDGVSLGEMQTIMLQKLEEMTLHMIDLKKENEQLKADNAEQTAINAEQSAANMQLLKRLEKLEEAMNHESH